MTAKEERQQLFSDVYNNKIPRRVPVNVSLSLDVVSGYQGISRKDALWNPSLVEDAADQLARRIETDVCVFGGNPRYPSQSQAMGSINSVMSSTGLMQHPNVVGLLENEYDRFIEDPYACMWEVILPRLYRELSGVNGERRLFALYQGMQAKGEDLAKIGAVNQKLTQQYGYYTAPYGVNAAAYACMDFITDNIRSFSGISFDIRRRPGKVAAAAEAVYPFNYLVGKPAVPHAEGACFFPLHMPTFMREKDFVKLWWPTFFRQAVDYASLGVHTRAFCEDDWMRYLDYIQELPTDTRLQFEYGDAKLIKERLGKKFILTGLFPLGTITQCSRQECIDRTKAFLDVMAPGGKFIFGFDKSPLVFADVNIDNLAAVCETVKEYGVYDNAGERAGDAFNPADYTHSDAPAFVSRYYRSWEEYLALYPETPDSARPRVEKLERGMLGLVYGLLL